VTGRRAALAAVLAGALAAAPPGRAADARGLRALALAEALRHLGRPYRDDCSGFVIAAWRAAGVSLRLRPARSRTESLQRASRRTETPRPGDLAFFHHTYDRDRDGLANDLFTHVALVEAVDGARLTLLHRSSRGIERLRMDLARPSDPGANDPVRALRRSEDARIRVLAGELFAGFGAFPEAGR